MLSSRAIRFVLPRRHHRQVQNFTTKVVRRRRRVGGDIVDDKIPNAVQKQAPFDELLPVDRTPFQPAQDNVDDYLKNASLSPWVPSPDPVARRMLQIADAGSDDVHYDLGSGDGRVNFMAIDSPFLVKRSVGIEVDEALIRSCEERMGKRHPRPTNISFIKKDITTEDVDLEGCTVLTMYFVEEALQKLKPILEKKLKGTGCKIITNGYEMKGWEPKWVETMLGLPIHMYEMTDLYDVDDNLSEEDQNEVNDEEYEQLDRDENDEEDTSYTAYGMKKEVDSFEEDSMDAYYQDIEEEESQGLILDDDYNDNDYSSSDSADDVHFEDNTKDEDNVEDVQEDNSKESRWKF